MPMYAIDGASPKLSDGAWAAPSADLIGDVRLGAAGERLVRGRDPRRQHRHRDRRGQQYPGRRDVPFSDPGAPLTIGARVTVGHQAILHGCTIADDCLIGLGARIFNGAVLESECWSAPARWSPKASISPAAA